MAALLTPVTPLVTSIGECGHEIIRDCEDTLQCTQCGEDLMSEWRTHLRPVTFGEGTCGQPLCHCWRDDCRTKEAA